MSLLFDEKTRYFTAENVINGGGLLASKMMNTS